MPTSLDNAAAFRELHTSGLLILPNAWDALSARLIESAGAQAIATTSAAMAWTHGYADGDQLPVTRLLSSVEAIARVLRVPFSVDIERGYSDDPATVAETVGAVIDAGAVGINIEDGIRPADLLIAKIQRIRDVAAQRGVDLFVNARTDVFLRALVPAEAQLDETLARTDLYRAAGADGIFVPGLVDAGIIARLVDGSPLPVNVLVRPHLPPASELQRLGVRRLSAGPWLCDSALERVRTLATQFLRDGRSEALLDAAIPYAEVNALFT